MRDVMKYRSIYANHESRATSHGSRITSHVLCSLLLAAFALSGCSNETIQMDVSGKGAVICEMRSGEVLFEKNPDRKFPPASTAKVMTAIIAVENVPLDEEIVPTEEAVDVEPTVAGLTAGVKYSLESLVEALLIKSGNDAARVIAHHIAGDEAAFSNLMNAKALELGMENTYFANASGLPTGRKDSQFITAKDLCILMRYAARNETLLRVLSVKEKDIKGDDEKSISLKTHNRSLFMRDDAPWGKTGYTREARRTFAGVDPSLEPKIVFALLKSNNLWEDILALNDQGIAAYEFNHRSLFKRIAGWMTGLVARDSGPVKSEQ